MVARPTNVMRRNLDTGQLALAGFKRGLCPCVHPLPQRPGGFTAHQRGLAQRDARDGCHPHGLWNAAAWDSPLNHTGWFTHDLRIAAQSAPCRQVSILLPGKCALQKATNPRQIILGCARHGRATPHQDHNQACQQ